MLGLPQPRSCAIGHFYKARPCPSPPPPTSAGGCSSCESSIALSADQPPPSGEGDLLLARPLRRSTARRSMKRMSVEDRPPRDLTKPQAEPRRLCFPCATLINIMCGIAPHRLPDWDHGKEPRGLRRVARGLLGAPVCTPPFPDLTALFSMPALCFCAGQALLEHHPPS